MSVSLQFALNVEDDWPPVGSESLPFEELTYGYKCLAVPLFIKELSVGDIISVEFDKSGFIHSWQHLEKSCRSTVWLLRMHDDPPISSCLHSLRLLKCNTAGSEDLGCYAIDVPPSLTLMEVDNVLEILDTKLVAIAFPSLRHVE